MPFGHIIGNIRQHGCDDQAQARHDEQPIEADRLDPSRQHRPRDRRRYRAEAGERREPRRTLLGRQYATYEGPLLSVQQVRVRVLKDEGSPHDRPRRGEIVAEDRKADLDGRPYAQSFHGRRKQRGRRQGGRAEERRLPQRRPGAVQVQLAAVSQQQKHGERRHASHGERERPGIRPEAGRPLGREGRQVGRAGEFVPEEVRRHGEGHEDGRVEGRRQAREDAAHGGVGEREGNVGRGRGRRHPQMQCRADINLSPDARCHCGNAESEDLSSSLQPTLS
mmetsp:Transcript_10750/g.20509  ORF Transcript_10750/g.20509 Transcript_10750/m.20509 type:complete len:279 (-) Transcript_10750:108-944(-)